MSVESPLSPPDHRLHVQPSQSSHNPADSCSLPQSAAALSTTPTLSTGPYVTTVNAKVITNNLTSVIADQKEVNVTIAKRTDLSHPEKLLCSQILRLLNVNDGDNDEILTRLSLVSDVGLVIIQDKIHETTTIAQSQLQVKLDGLFQIVINLASFALSSGFDIGALKAVCTALQMELTRQTKSSKIQLQKIVLRLYEGDNIIIFFIKMDAQETDTSRTLRAPVEASTGSSWYRFSAISCSLLVVQNDYALADAIDRFIPSFDIILQNQNLKFNTIAQQKNEVRRIWPDFRPKK